MALDMRTACDRCGGTLRLDGEAWICSFECTFCQTCVAELRHLCPNCNGQLLPRPRRSDDLTQAVDPEGDFDVYLRLDETMAYEPLRYIWDFSYDIIVDRRPAGRLRLIRYCQHSAENDGIDIIDEADEVDQEVYDTAVHFYGPKGKLTKHAPIWPDLAYLASVRLDAPYRGLGIGLLSATYALNAHGQMASAAVLPKPQQFRRPDEYPGQFEGLSEPEALRRLSRHWRQLGLRRRTGRYLWASAEEWSPTIIKLP